MDSLANAAQVIGAFAEPLSAGANTRGLVR
jgi:hypothetical protein